jgi:hypothetical protein
MKSGKEHKKLSIPGLSQGTESEDVQDGPIAETKLKSPLDHAASQEDPDGRASASGRLSG